MVEKIYKVEQGYDIVSEHYDTNKWNKFWKANEAPYIKKWLHKIPKGFGLDAGSGTGMYLEEIINAGHSCIELDISAKMLWVNKRNHPNIPPIKTVYLRARIDKKLFAAQIFDWILCTRVLSHCKNLSKQISNFSAILKPGAECLISDIHPEHDYHQTGFNINDEKKIYIETHKHTIEEYKKIITENNFEILNLIEVGMDDLFKKPDPIKFEKLYTRKLNKIFFIFILRKLS
jgi:2-polyprenyl-3-methyl-5-hydroxy-6-metoxy-1,4-benzoquinol methylase